MIFAASSKLEGARGSVGPVKGAQNLKWMEKIKTIMFRYFLSTLNKNIPVTVLGGREHNQKDRMHNSFLKPTKLKQNGDDKSHKIYYTTNKLFVWFHF